MSPKIIVLLLLASFAILCNAKPINDSEEEFLSPFHEQNFSAEIPEHEEYVLESEELLPHLPTSISRDLVDPSNKHIVKVTKYDGETVGSRQKRALIFRPLFVYKQQEVKRQRIENQRKQKQQIKKNTPKPVRRNPNNQG